MENLIEDKLNLRIGSVEINNDKIIIDKSELYILLSIENPKLALDVIEQQNKAQELLQETQNWEHELLVEINNLAEAQKNWQRKGSFHNNFIKDILRMFADSMVEL